MSWFQLIQGVNRYQTLVFKAFLDLFKIISDRFLDGSAYSSYSYSSTCTVGKYKGVLKLCSPARRKV